MDIPYATNMSPSLKSKRGGFTRKHSLSILAKKEEEEEEEHREEKSDAGRRNTVLPRRTNIDNASNLTYCKCYEN
jgi:hypothetical protein